MLQQQQRASQSSRVPRMRRSLSWPTRTTTHTHRRRLHVVIILVYLFYPPAHNQTRHHPPTTINRHMNNNNMKQACPSKNCLTLPLDVRTLPLGAQYFLQRGTVFDVELKFRCRVDCQHGQLDRAITTVQGTRVHTCARTTTSRNYRQNVSLKSDESAWNNLLNTTHPHPRSAPASMRACMHARHTTDARTSSWRARAS